MYLSIKGKRGPLRFWPDNKSLEQICRDIASIDLKPTLHRRMKHQERETFDFTEIEECSEWEQMVEEQDFVNLAIQYLEDPDLVVEEVYMTEIQLRRIVDRTAKEITAGTSIRWRRDDDQEWQDDQQILQGSHEHW
jgi:hypothetical protein